MKQLLYHVFCSWLYNYVAFKDCHHKSCLVERTTIWQSFNQKLGWIGDRAADRGQLQLAMIQMPLLREETCRHVAWSSPFKNLYLLHFFTFGEDFRLFIETWTRQKLFYFNNNKNKARALIGQWAIYHFPMGVRQIEANYANLLSCLIVTAFRCFADFLQHCF